MSSTFSTNDDMTTKDHLLRLMSLPLSRFSDVTRSSDGYYLAAVHGDLGFNAFLGRPSPVHPGPGYDAMLKHWTSMLPGERVAVKALAVAMGIPLCKDFGVPK